MKINHNISAVITNKQLLRTEDTLAKSMERLSSGLSINHAKDNPSGMAISGKMKAQIDGLGQASSNSSDGISVIETADGALNEVSSIIQRMRELSVQAANDTNAQSEKEAIQTEISSLKEEIDRISSTTEFNTKSLLDGSLDTRIYGNNVSRVTSTEYVSAGTYKFTVDNAALQASIPATVAINNLSSVTSTLAEGETGVVEINGVKVELKKDMSDMEIYEALRKGSELAECTIPDFNTTEALSFKSKEFGNDAYIKVLASDNIAAGMGLSPSQDATGTNAKLTLNTTPPDSIFGAQSTYVMEGNKVTFTNTGGFKMSMLLDEGYTGDINLNVTDIGPMDLQIGANEGQQMTVRIPSVSLNHLYLDDLDVSTIHGADRGIAQLDSALTRLNEIRASLGAYENRLEHTVASLDGTEENLTAAISRIQDVDMAEEMVEYTKDNVLAQAGTSALSQANELPQMALQLLQ